MRLNLIMPFRIHFRRIAVKRISKNFGSDLVTNLLARCYVNNLLPGAHAARRRSSRPRRCYQQDADVVAGTSGHHEQMPNGMEVADPFVQ